MKSAQYNDTVFSEAYLRSIGSREIFERIEAARESLAKSEGPDVLRREFYMNGGSAELIPLNLDALDYGRGGPDEYAVMITANDWYDHRLEDWATDEPQIDDAEVHLAQCQVINVEVSSAMRIAYQIIRDVLTVTTIKANGMPDTLPLLERRDDIAAMLEDIRELVNKAAPSTLSPITEEKSEADPISVRNQVSDQRKETVS